MRKIDIHTHKQENTHLAIINASLNQNNLDDNCWYAIGIHPCETSNAQLDKLMIELNLKGNKKNVLAIGECGLDRLCNTSLDIQRERFAVQINLANQLSKPLIIHCVRAHDEVLMMLKKQHNQVPVVFHGFNNNIHIAEKCLTAGYYLSFGQSIFHARSAAVFKQMPLDKIFLETDDSDLKIQDVYIKAAEILGVSASYLSEQIQKNFSNLFKI